MLNKARKVNVKANVKAPKAKKPDLKVMAGGKKDGVPKAKKMVKGESYLPKEDAQRLADLNIRTYMEPDDKDGMPYVINFHGFTTNWTDKKGATTLARQLADAVLRERKIAVREAEEQDEVVEEG